MDSQWTQMPKKFKSQIIGKLLGDGAITKQKGRLPRFKFQHTIRECKCERIVKYKVHLFIKNQPFYTDKTVDF